MAALKAIPGFSQVMKAFMKIWDEKVARIKNMSMNLQLSEKQMEKYYNMLLPICEKLEIDVPELYVTLDVTANACTWGDTKPYIVVNSGLFEFLIIAEDGEKQGIILRCVYEKLHKDVLGN